MYINTFTLFQAILLTDILKYFKDLVKSDEKRRFFSKKKFEDESVSAAVSHNEINTF